MLVSGSRTLIDQTLAARRPDTSSDPIVGRSQVRPGTSLIPTAFAGSTRGSSSALCILPWWSAGSRRYLRPQAVVKQLNAWVVVKFESFSKKLENHSAAEQWLVVEAMSGELCMWRSDDAVLRWEGDDLVVTCKSCCPERMESKTEKVGRTTIRFEGFEDYKQRAK